MSEVKHYAFDQTGCPVEVDGGGWVESGDYDALAADNKRLREALVAASKAHSKAEVGLITDAALADPEAEPVEVVGYLLTKGNQLSRMPAGGSDFPLMTVAQHNRIMASAPQHDAELLELLIMVRAHGWYHPLDEHEIARIDAKLATLSAKNEGGKA